LTAEQVFDEVGELMPGVSLPTVYATLELLRDLGLIERWHTGVATVVYDSRTEDHQHLVCRRCGAIADVETQVGTRGLLAAARDAGFTPLATQVVVSGLCADCAAA